MDEILPTPELTMLKNNKEGGYNYRERRHDPWKETYELYRDKVTINRLTQRQSVNLPLMKQCVRTLLKDVDDMPVIQFENLDNNKDAEIFKNEYWKLCVDENKMDIQDIVDKKQVFFYGRSFDQWQVVDGKIKMTVQDPIDMLVSRYTDPFDLHSSRFLIHTHIFKPFSYLENNPNYDQAKVKELKQWYGTETGLIKARENKNMLQGKNEKMKEMGVDDVDNPILGEAIVELTQHFVFRKEPGEIEDQIYYYVEADDMVILMKKKLEEVIGVTKDHYFQTHYPYVSWADDVERQDFWSDGIGDTVRTPNKVLNSWFSQMVENRTLRNFGMNYYDASIEGFTPPTNQPPIPGGWYPLPGKPAEVYQKVDVPDLSESLDEMTFLIQMMEKATGATATQQGAVTERQITLGEVELALGEAKERIKGMSKFYTQAWKDRGILFDRLCEAAGDKITAVKIHKKGRNSMEVFTREIAPNDWMSKEGYAVKVWSQDEKNDQTTKELEKLNAVKANMPDNPKLDEVYKRKLLEFANLNPDEVNMIMEYEEKKSAMLANGMLMGGSPMNVPQQQPAQPVQAPVQQAPVVRPVNNRAKEVNKKKKQGEAVKKLKSIKGILNKRS